MILNPLIKTEFWVIIPTSQVLKHTYPPSMEYKAIYTDGSKSVVFSEQRDIGISHATILLQHFTGRNNSHQNSRNNRQV